MFSMINMITKLLTKLRCGCITSGEVDYINGADKLPPPLSKEEEAKTLLMLDSDFEKARETLIVHNLRLVVYIAKKFETTGIGIEDLISIGTIGLIKAVNTFSIEKNIKLSIAEVYGCIDTTFIPYLSIMPFNFNRYSSLSSLWVLKNISIFFAPSLPALSTASEVS